MGIVLHNAKSFVSYAIFIFEEMDKLGFSFAQKVA